MIKEKRTADTKGEKAVVAGAHNAFPISYRIAHIRQDKSPITSPLPPPASFYQTAVVMLVATTTQAEKVKHVKDPIKTAGEMKKKMTNLAHPKTRSNIRSKRNREETMSRKTKKSRFLERES